MKFNLHLFIKHIKQFHVLITPKYIYEIIANLNEKICKKF
jgi:hypothetical protein